MTTPSTAHARVFRLSLVLVLLAGSIGGGCARVKEDTAAQRLESALSGYRQAIRWGYYPAATGYVDAEQRREIDLKALKNVRVTGYEIVEPAVIGDGRATQLVQIDYVLNDRQVLRSIADRQRWRYDEQAGAWWLESGLPAFENR